MDGFQVCRCIRAGVIVLPETGSSSSPLVTVRERELLLVRVEVDWNLPLEEGRQPQRASHPCEAVSPKPFHQPTCACRQRCG